ncbi:hypothetical protein ACQCT3_06405 [Sutcliffiella horikoshii]|nr:hypothetical protein [Bacillus sp. m3-13]
MKELILKDGNEFAEYKLETYATDFKVVEVNVSDSTESLPALVNPIKLNY